MIDFDTENLKFGADNNCKQYLYNHSIYILQNDNVNITYL